MSLVVLQLLAFWPVWRWYGVRVTAGPADEMWGLLALATAMLLLLWRKKEAADEKEANLLLPVLLLLLYALTYNFFPPLLRAAVAVTALGCTLGSLRFGKPFHAGTLGLLYLSLPLIPSLQFYGGYPLRVFVASLAAPLLRLGGFAVIREGTCLNWDGQLSWIDAPCSGIRMLWVGLYLVFTLACVYELRFVKTLLAMTIAVFAIIFGNVFRSVALFYLESGVIVNRPWAHDFTGVAAFTVVALCIVAAVRQIRKEKICDAHLST
jgi:exosortase/archaeosortase family protein